MINSQEITLYHKRIDFLENELAEAKLKIMDLEQQLISSLGTIDTKPVLCRENFSQYDSSDILQDSPVIEVLTADVLAQVAESSVAQSSFVYDKNTGMYYDHLSKCYYDAERSLYYDPSNGIYYSYNEVTQSYDFHSQLSVQEFNTISHVIQSKACHSGFTDKDKNKKKQQKIHSNFNCTGVEKRKSEAEDGEIFSNDEDSDIDDDEEEDRYSNQIYLQKKPEMYKPCIRVVIKSSDCLPINSLYILTCKGATIGRDESLKHDILLSDPTVSRTHCSIKFDDSLKEYFVIDERSTSGTFINNQRIGESKEVSHPYPLQNLSQLRVGNSLLELHIHPCLDTCPGCEPWNLKTTEENLVQTSGHPSKDEQRRWQLKMIKKKYGLKNMNYEKLPMASKLSKTYQDRSRKRRLEVGSDCITVDDVPASVNMPLSESNIGHKMLKKMGWKAGKSLGKSQTGILEPIKAEIRVDERAGIGSSTSVGLDSIKNISRLRNLLITKARYDESFISEERVINANCDL